MAKPYRFCPVCGAYLVRRKVGVSDRFVCTDAACDFVYWDNPVPVAAAVVEHEGRIVLARNRAWPPKMFGLITGFIERGEDPEAAAAREVQEELALQARIVTFIGVYSFAPQNQLIVGYHVEASGTIQLSEELAEYKAFEPERLRPWRFGTGLVMADWLHGRGLPVHFYDVAPQPGGRLKRY